MPKKVLQLVKTRIFYEFLKIVKSALFQNNARSSQVEPVAKLRRKSREQATFSTFVLIATEARPQAAVHESEPLDA